MVACTFISAPLMFVSAKMITLTKTDPSEYIKQLDSFTLDVSIIATVACCWVIFVFVLTKKITRLPHKITACLIISQLISCLGAILWNTLNQKEGIAGFIQSSLFIIGVYSTRLWTTILAITLLFLQCRSLCYVLKLQPLFFLAGWGLPVCITVILLLFESKKQLPLDKRNPNFVYGTPQAIIAVTLLVLCFIRTLNNNKLQQMSVNESRMTSVK
jgi:signal transduction histidine kinase